MDCTCASFNFRQIFDYLCHMQICTTMLEIGFPFHLIRLMYDLHNNKQLVVLLLLACRILKWFLVLEIGLSQGNEVNWFWFGCRCSWFYLYMYGPTKRLYLTQIDGSKYRLCIKILKSKDYFKIKGWVLTKICSIFFLSFEEDG